MKYLLGKSFRFHYGTKDYRSNFDAIDWADTGNEDGPADTERPRRLIRNAARCKRCGDIVESRHRHDFRPCKCGAVTVDGGLDYLRRCGDIADIEDLSEYSDDE